MGCDIHLHAEVKINGKWEHYADINQDRNYAAFGHMAGVRSTEIEPLVQPRGLPENMSIVTAIDARTWGADMHTPGWLNAEEIAELSERLRTDENVYAGYGCHNLWGYFFGNYYESFLKYPEDMHDGIEDVRFVFWFDN